MMTRRSVLTALAAMGLSTAARGQVPKKQGARRKKAGGAENGDGLANFDAIMDEVLEQNQVVGGSLAIAREGRLVLARGYGLADLETQAPVTPQTLFCIASVTKAVSAVATLKLIDQGKLRLEAKLMNLLSAFAPAGQEPVDPRMREITVHHLLYHASGIPDRVKPSEPGEDNDGPSNDAKAMYQAMFTKKLDFAPGSEHRYSNSAFLILRLVIEHASKRPYVPFVLEEILAPMGIKRIEMEAQKPIANETSRYVLGPNGLRPAVRNPVNWLATPSDMVRFVTSLDGSRGAPFLSNRIYRQMLAPPPPPVTPGPNGRHVGLGWDAVKNTPQGDLFSKNGGKPGVSAWLEHLPSGVSWAFMINTTKVDKSAPNPAQILIRRIDQAIAAQSDWPRVDLFKD